MTKLKDKLVKAADRVWKAFLEFGPVDDGRPEGDEFDDALISLRVAYRATQHQTSAERAALVDIVNDLSAPPDPIHFKVREAIIRASKILQESDLIVKE